VRGAIKKCSSLLATSTAGIVLNVDHVTIVHNILLSAHLKLSVGNNLEDNSQCVRIMIGDGENGGGGVTFASLPASL
jgi:hypothetical protein